jgi:hypothetical protein
MEFKVESFLNPYLPLGTNRIDAIITVSAEGGNLNSLRTGARAVVGLIIDTSGSMQGERMLAAKHATRKAIELLDESTWFFVVEFSDQASVVCELAQATSQNKAAADERLRRLITGGSTRMSLGLNLARNEFLKMPDAIHYALFLTDGKNDHDDEYDLDAILNYCDGVFQCDCRGVGTDWQTKQLQKISLKLLGNAMIIPEPAGIENDFRDCIQKALSRGVADVQLRLWTPKSARILICKQMSPEIVVLTDRATQLDAQTFDYPTGAWGKESRDYYVALEVAPGEIGDEVLACRPSVVYQETPQSQKTKVTGNPVVATWTEDEQLSARINDQVAHYTGQEELASALQEGLEARARNDIEVATRLLGRAAKLAAKSGNDEITKRLAKVVDIVDVEQGTVRLKPKVAKADEMDLDLSSRRTARAGRKAK